MVVVAKIALCDGVLKQPFHLTSSSGMNAMHETECKVGLTWKTARAWRSGRSWGPCGTWRACAVARHMECRIKRVDLGIT